MIRVANQKCIRNLSTKSLKASKSRNIIAITAIILTTVLFTALFTVILSINASFQAANFRQVGGFAHGGFKYLTAEQYQTLQSHPLIEETGLRRFLGMPEDPPFNKSHVEVGYSDATQAHFMYCDPHVGNLPQEGSNQAATDTKVLTLLGVAPEIGAPFTVTFTVDGIKTTQTFILSGWWEADQASNANHILIPESRLNQILDELSISPPGNDGMTGAWNLDVLFSNSQNIAQKLQSILSDNGFQSDDPSQENYIATGVNWGYTGAQLANSFDLTTSLAIVLLLFLIILTGYLIIYNIFQISVVTDIQFYGLLKTIGTSSRQIRSLIYRQAFILSIIGIPIGLLCGWLIGVKLTPLILSQLNGVDINTFSHHPAIFILSACFALLTVFLSCCKPGRKAGKIAPIEAIRFSEGSQKNILRQTSSKLSPFSMAKANLSRNRTKTAITIISMALAMVLFNAMVLFTNGFDMNKYLADKSISDFIVASADYFQIGGLFSTDSALDSDSLANIKAQPGIRSGGVIYGMTSSVQEFISEDYYRNHYSQWNNTETVDQMLETAEYSAEGKIATDVQIFGMEDYPLSKLKVIEGDLSLLNQSGTIAAVYTEDDYNNPITSSNWAKIGDIVTLRYVDQWEYVNPDTGQIYGDLTSIPDSMPYISRALTYREISYTVAALVTVPSSLSYRYYGSDEFVLSANSFIADSGTAGIMLYAFDTTNESSNASMENYLSDYSQTINPEIDYESKASYQSEFESFQKMFFISGSLLCLIIGLVGLLNFFNANLSSILTRSRQFAMLQSIGMTGRQLKTMLVAEGLLYAFSCIILAMIISLLINPLLAIALSSVLWFFTAHITIAPILILAPFFIVLGCAIPLLIYRIIASKSIVERLRESEY
ncbi:ABC transporter permease [Eubacteriaceae bacterium ES2]|nr:ABC transporter permease [Eubacteriaceae bacterium ES2]